MGRYLQIMTKFAAASAVEVSGHPQRCCNVAEIAQLVEQRIRNA